MGVSILIHFRVEIQLQRKVVLCNISANHLQIELQAKKCFGTKSVLVQRKILGHEAGVEHALQLKIYKVTQNTIRVKRTKSIHILTSCQEDHVIQKREGIHPAMNRYTFPARIFYGHLCYRKGACALHVYKEQQTQNRPPM